MFMGGIIRWISIGVNNSKYGDELLPVINYVMDLIRKLIY